MYRIDYSPETELHLRALTARNQNLILDEIDKQLTYQPHIETRNRKPMRHNSLAPWELRIDDFRVYYDFTHEPELTVYIRAIGIKKRNVVYIGNQEIKL